VKTVLFACVHNAGRSQMAAAWFNHLVASERAQALSAGVPSQ
jgi:arsenate reductase